jgi:hypothetical protein
VRDAQKFCPHRVVLKLRAVAPLRDGAGQRVPFTKARLKRNLGLMLIVMFWMTHRKQQL